LEQQPCLERVGEQQKKNEEVVEPERVNKRARKPDGGSSHFLFFLVGGRISSWTLISTTVFLFFAFSLSALAIPLDGMAVLSYYILF